VHDSIGIDADRAVPDRGDLAVGVDTAGGGFVAADSDTSRGKVSRV
jgi:hypothetical protein